jgi:lipopolysaccharide assembly protein A
MRLLIAVPLLLLLVLFALSNTDPVRIRLWPTDLAAEVSLSLAVLVGMGAAFLFGGLLVWFSALAQRSRARRAEAQVRILDEQMAELRARLARADDNAPSLPPPS